MCNCWKEGKCKPPPLPVYIDEEHYLNPIAEDVESWYIIQNWMEGACEHEHMEFRPPIANLAGYGNFREALEAIDQVHFPTLIAQLPTANGGSTPAEASVTCLEELNFFQESIAAIKQSFLIDTITGQELYGEGIILYSTDPQVPSLIIDGKGFCIFNKVNDKELFRAQRFTQGFLKQESREQLVEYTAFDSDQSYICHAAISGRDTSNPNKKLNANYPTQLHTIVRHLEVQDFAYILKPLTYIFEKSVETGNPVRWS